MVDEEMRGRVGCQVSEEIGRERIIAVKEMRNGVRDFREARDNF
jgi:hypothetical protein